MAASDLPDANQDKCVLTLTPATRAGAIIAFKPNTDPTAYCKGVKSLDAQTGLVVYALNQPMLAGDDPVAALSGVDRSELFQAGIQTNEDPWPAIRGLATFIVDHKAPISDKPPGSAPAVEAMMGATGIPDSFAQHVQPADPKTATCTHEDRYVGLWFLPGLESEMWPEAFGLVVKPDRASIEALRMSIQELMAVDPDTDPMDYKSQLQNLRQELVDAARFNMNRVDLCANQDPRAERWYVFNLSHQLHNVHIHQLKFGVDAIRSSSCAGDMHDLFLDTSATDDPGDCEKIANEVFRDVPTVSLPLPPAAGGDMAIAAAPTDAARGRKPPKFGVHDTFPVPPMGRIDIRIVFDSIEKTGNYVFHRHILEHEDAGMMAQIAVQSSTVH